MSAGVQVCKSVCSPDRRCGWTLRDPPPVPTPLGPHIETSQGAGLTPGHDTLEVSIVDPSQYCSDLISVVELFLVVMFVYLMCAGKLPYPNTEVWTHNVCITGKVSMHRWVV